MLCSILFFCLEFLFHRISVSKLDLVNSIKNYDVSQSKLYIRTQKGNEKDKKKNADSKYKMNECDNNSSKTKMKLEKHTAF